MDREQIKRIKDYELLLRSTEQLLCSDNLTADLRKKLQEQIKELSDYYGSPDWKKDYQDDEAGLLPSDLPRGVLSEDGIYNVLERFTELEKETKRHKQNIIMIGMPGCGKSTCGVLLAKSLCKSFVDTDLLIQSAEGMKLQDILDKEGYLRFAELEERVLTELNVQDCVVATGGSAVYYEPAMTHLKENGIIIYLRISLPVMMERIRNIKTRGILLKQNETMEEMFHSREDLYQQYADVIIDCDSLSVEQTVNEIYNSLRDYLW